MKNRINILSISKIRAYTDGDNVSTLVASKGCNLRCAYCINPESWDETREDRYLTVEELYNEVKIYNLYYLATGGGLIFGGGEPLIYHDFIKEFIEKYKDTGWKFTLETSLSTNKKNLENIIDYIDYYIIDTKDMNKQRYEAYTRGNYDLFIENLTYLLGIVGEEKIELRVPKIHGLHKSNEYEDNYNSLKNMGFNNIHVFKYMDPENFKKISDKAFLNKKSFIEKYTDFKSSSF